VSTIACIWPADILGISPIFRSTQTRVAITRACPRTAAGPGNRPSTLTERQLEVDDDL
jgi:hypothetical protein